MPKDANATNGDDTLFRRQAVEAAYLRHGSPIGSIGVASWVLTGFLLLVPVAAIAFLSLAHFARKETVSGIVEPSAGALRVVSPRSGIVDEIFVKDDQLVVANQPIARVKFDAADAQSGKSLGAMLAASSGLEQAQLGAQGASHRLSIAHQREELAAKRLGLVEHISRLDADITLQQQRIELQTASVESVRKLNERKIVDDLQYRDRLDTLLQSQQNASALRRDVEDSRSQIAQIDAEDARLDAEGAEAGHQLDATRSDLNTRMVSYAGESSAMLTAPKGGRVVSIQAKQGEPLSAGVALATLVPADGGLQAQLWAPSRAIGFVSRGNSVRIMYDAFPYAHFGVGHGRVISISRIPVLPKELPVPIETNEGLYRIDVALDRTSVSAYGRDWPLSPGMTFKADIVVESRTFLEWLLDPLLALKRRSAP